MSKKFACATCGEEYTDVQDDKCPFDGTKLTPIAEELSPGTVLNGRYEIKEAISGGAMGRIYKAHHQLMNRTIAIKTMLPQMVGSGGALQRFKQEAQSLSSLSHPNILTVFDFFIGDDGLPYLVMDYLEGTNLDEVRKTGPLAAPRAVHIFSQVCDALGTAHKAGIIHRDVKPHNIMLVKHGDDPDYVKVIDFGIAKLLEPSESSQLTATGDVFGTPQYMSPEQCRARPLDVRSDIYSLGCVMYASLTGTPPFTGDDPMQCMYKHANEDPPGFPEGSDVPKPLQEAVLKALEKQPADRFQTMEQLKAAITGTPVAAAPAEAFREKPLLPHVPVKYALGALAAVVLLSVGIGFAQVHQNKNQPTPRPTSAAMVGSQSTAPTAPTFEQNMAEGQRLFKQGDFAEAKAAFNAAHEQAERYGEADRRFLDSMEWQGKVEARLGNYSLAKQAFQYVAYA
jgi:serine/threonine protein kinase